MSILIKGLKIPKNCCECFAFKTNASGMMFCRAGKTAFEKEDAEWLPLRVSDHCPLIELPDHGDLIDRDALSAAMYHEAFETDSNMQRWDSGCWIRYKMFENKRNDAPVVIPAERSEV